MKQSESGLLWLLPPGVARGIQAAQVNLKSAFIALGGAGAARNASRALHEQKARVAEVNLSLNRIGFSTSEPVSVDLDERAADREQLMPPKRQGTRKQVDIDLPAEEAKEAVRDVRASSDIIA